MNASLFFHFTTPMCLLFRWWFNLANFWWFNFTKFWRFKVTYYKNHT